jgi:hypothetical protein
VFRVGSSGQGATTDTGLEKVKEKVRDPKHRWKDQSLWKEDISSFLLEGKKGNWI